MSVVYTFFFGGGGKGGRGLCGKLLPMQGEGSLSLAGSDLASLVL